MPRSILTELFEQLHRCCNDYDDENLMLDSRGDEPIPWEHAIFASGCWFDSRYKFRCRDCERIIDWEDLKIIDEKAYHADCVGICAHCGEEVPASRLAHIENKTYCRNCVVRCNGCGNWIPSEEATRQIDSEGAAYTFCPSCVATRPHCAECGNILSRYEHYEINGEAVCSACYTRHLVRCLDCGDCALEEDMVRGDDGRLRCPSCNRNYQARMVNYSWKPDDPYFVEAGETFVKGKPQKAYFGIEIEMDGGGNNFDTVAEIMKVFPREMAWAKTDGSLDNGVEIITTPMSLAYVQSDQFKDRLTQLHETALQYDYLSHKTDTCGLHVHVSAQGFQDGAHALRASEFINSDRNFPDIKKFSRRKHWGYCNRVNPEEEWEEYFDDYNWDEPVQIFRGDREALFPVKLAVWAPGSRYSTVNFQNYGWGIDTVEFRLFRGSLVPETIIAAIEFCQAVINVTKDPDSFEKADFGDLSLEAIHNFPTLANYLIEKDLMIEPRETEPVVEVEPLIVIDDLPMAA